MTQSIPVNNEIKLVQIKLTQDILEDAYWLNVFYECEETGEIGTIEEILYVTRKPVHGILDAVNESELIDGFQFNDYCESDEEYFDAGDTVWALVNK